MQTIPKSVALTLTSRSMQAEMRFADDGDRPAARGVYIVHLNRENLPICGFEPSDLFSMCGENVFGSMARTNRMQLTLNAKAVEALAQFRAEVYVAWARCRSRMLEAERIGPDLTPPVPFRPRNRKPRDAQPAQGA